MEKTIEPQKIIYLNKIGDLWLVWLNTNHPSCSINNPPYPLGTSFEDYEESAIFAQAWADGITARDSVECEVMIDMTMPKKSDLPEITLDTEGLQSFAESIGILADVFVKFTEAAKTLAKVLNTVDIKRIYLGCAYSYNILTRFKFLVKSPKIVSGVSGMIMWFFMHLPKWVILRWPSPELRD